MALSLPMLAPPLSNPLYAASLFNQNNGIHISQVYGGGGNSGATLQSDFVELLNGGNETVDISSWSIQYASAEGTNWQVTTLDSIVLPPSSYLLIKQGSGDGGSDGGTPLEVPDVVGTIKMSASQGKVALVMNSDAISGLSDPDVVDFIGYGGANEFEGSGAAPGLSNTTAALRKNNGCVDSDQNGDDFEELNPNPRNSGSPIYLCSVPPSDTPISTETATLVSTNTPVPTDTPLPLPTDTLLPTPTETLLPASTNTSLPTVTDTLVPTLTDTPVPTVIPTPLPQLLITELMANPNSVDDSSGEWLELANLESYPVNLNGWHLADQGSDQHTISADVIIPPGGYVVLARNGDPNANGGVQTHYVYSGLSLANEEDELLLLAPDSTEVDRVIWGGTSGLSIVAGASLERATLGLPASWATAHSPWSGSWGDLGSPGGPYMAPLPTATPAPTDTLLPSETATVVLINTPTNSPIPLPTDTPLPSSTSTPLPRLRISEVMANPASVSDSDGEWLEIANPEGYSVNLNGWFLADQGSDRHQITVDVVIPPGGIVVLARNGDSNMNGGVQAAYVYSGLSLANEADELILLGPDDSVVDSLFWGNGSGLTITTGATLERTNLGEPTAWATAHSPWPGSWGDLGSPGALYSAPIATDTPIGAPTPTWTSAVPATPTPSNVTTDTPTPISLDTATAQPTPTWTAMSKETPTALPFGSKVLLITEVMANPAAVSDSDGEWIELFNTTTIPINLNGWIIADQDSDYHVINADLIIQPSTYVVLARNGDFGLNGGVRADYVYSSFELANSADELLLLAPDGSEIDRLVWGDGTEVQTSAGASLERTTLTESLLWESASTVWPSSSGDKGSPGSEYIALAMPTATVPPVQTLLSTPTLVNSPTLISVTSTPVPTLAASWLMVTAPSPLQIEEVSAHGSTLEYIVLFNTSPNSLSLNGWTIGDAHFPGSGEGMYALPTTAELAPGSLYILARNGIAFREQWGRLPNAEFEESDPNIPTLERRRDFATGTLALKDAGDEVVLLNPENFLADGLAYGNGEYGALGLTGTLYLSNNYTLQRVPNAQLPYVRDVRHRFLLAPSLPFETRSLPSIPHLTPPTLDSGLVAVWGSLGSHSNFTPSYTAPPHYLAAAAGAMGLDFIAIADPAGEQNALNTYAHPPTILHLPAWQWQGTDNEHAVVYAPQTTATTDRNTFVEFLTAISALAQWQDDPSLQIFNIVAVAADSIQAPGSLSRLYDKWYIAQSALLPAGNSNPNLPGIVNNEPRYTGLAVASTEVDHLGEAVAGRRGWLTNRPGLWLTLRAQLADGSQRWMGQTVPSANQMTLHIYYGDREGEVAGLALWQDNQPVRQLDIPPVDGRWTVNLPAVPGSFIYAVATQLDGDFAVTAPLRVESATGGIVFINEVLPAPGDDHNGDGEINGDDEFTELYNPGAQPVSLVGWQLSDSRGDESPSRRFTFGPGRFIGGGEYLLLWRTEIGINLNNDGDYMRLLNSAGEEIDAISWEESPNSGRSISRIPDGQAWQSKTETTPGQANRAGEVASIYKPPATDNSPFNRPPGTSSDNPDSSDSDNSLSEQEQNDTPSSSIAPNFGQAAGSPGSLTEAKYLGLERWVEFQAIVTVPTGLFNSAIYVAEPAPTSDSPIAGLGIQVYLLNCCLPDLQEGDRVLVRGTMASFRGEMELKLQSANQIWHIEPGIPLQPLPVTASEIGESLEGRLVTFSGIVDGWSRDSIYLINPNRPTHDAVRVTVRSSLEWRKPYVNQGERWQVTGVVSQFAREAPWNGGYRVLARYEQDLVKIE